MLLVLTRLIINLMIGTIMFNIGIFLPNECDPKALAVLLYFYSIVIFFSNECDSKAYRTKSRIVKAVEYLVYGAKGAQHKEGHDITTQCILGDQDSALKAIASGITARAASPTRPFVALRDEKQTTTLADVQIANSALRICRAR